VVYYNTPPNTLCLSYCFILQTDIVDEIPTVKFVYISWVGDNVKPMSKAKISTHKGALEEMFYVSFVKPQIFQLPLWLI